jgi:hypothetical protein
MIERRPRCANIDKLKYRVRYSTSFELFNSQFYQRSIGLPMTFSNHCWPIHIDPQTGGAVILGENYGREARRLRRLLASDWRTVRASGWRRLANASGQFLPSLSTAPR